MEWNLRLVMADRGLFKTTDLVPLLAARDVHLSREQVYRLATGTPQRVNMEVLAALCDALACTPNDLMAPVAVPAAKARTGTDDAGRGVGDLRPVRAQIRRPRDAG
jgi:DNA-binding Xre family transcriptional regulator